MENILTPEEKKILNFFCKYIRTHGETEVTFRIEETWESDNFDMGDIEGLRSEENYYMEIPHNIYGIILKVINLAKKDERYPDDYENIWGEVEINSKDKTIDVYHAWRELNKREEYSSADKDYYEDSETLKTAFKELEEMFEGQKKVNVPFSGYGDSGGIEADFEVPSHVENFCYGWLSDNYGGWEINEGSSGEFIFDLRKKTVECDFYWNDEDTHRESLLELKF